MFYCRRGEIPPKRHTQFRQPDGSLYAEELVSSKGFSGQYSILYHVYPPTQVKEIQKPIPFEARINDQYPLLQTHLKTSGLGVTGQDYLEGRKIFLKNADVSIGVCNLPARTAAAGKEAAASHMEYFYKNAEADEVIYLHEGNGFLYSPFGKLRVKKGDYVVIPRTTIYRFEFDEGEEIRLLVIESASPVETPRRYRNELGQLLEHSPFCERDIRQPEELITERKKGEYLLKIKKGGYLHPYLYAHSPLDVVGWDGYLYPYAFSIYEFEPITGRIHQPPPVHQTFQGDGFVICSFVPRLFDYHPLSIPAPYNHSNIDSDEVLFYAEGNFMSRKGIDRGSFTLHPGGLPHGPHPGTVEKSIGARETHEYAVMVDTFRPLQLTHEAMPFVDENYPMSWNE